MFTVFGVGVITSKVELGSVGTTQVAKFSLVQNEKIKGKDNTVKEVTSFFDCELWDTGAKYFQDNANVGDSLYIEGTPRLESWIDKETGEKRKRFYIRVKTFRVIPKKVQ